MQIRHNPLSGGYCGEVPPLPIPNREVKLTCADGTAMQCGRVGSRLLSSRASDFERFLRLFCFHADSADDADLFLLFYPLYLFSFSAVKLLQLFSCMICFLENLCSFMKKNERKTCSYNIFYYFCSQIHKTLNN